MAGGAGAARAYREKEKEEESLSAVAAAASAHAPYGAMSINAVISILYTKSTTSLHAP